MQDLNSKVADLEGQSSAVVSLTPTGNLSNRIIMPYSLTPYYIYEM